MTLSPESPANSRHVVTAVLVAHDGARWLPRTLDGIQAQERPVQQLVAVDTGSQDETRQILEAFLGTGNVLTRKRDTGFGVAVSYALKASGLPRAGHGGGETSSAEGGVVEWVWLLHDDSEPAPDALGRLIAVVDEMSSVAVVGPKILAWYNRHQLLEVGVTIAGNGARETGLERREQDQGQHDDLRDVLAVSSAGMLVRRDVWEQLQGFDRNLALMRDDVDFCWRVRSAGHRVLVVPDAVLYHAEAVSHERRRIDAALDRPHMIDRANALYTLLVNQERRALPATFVRLVVGTLFRVVFYLVTKLPGFASDEFFGLLAVLARPDRIFSARRRRKRTRVLLPRQYRHLFPARGTQLRHGVDRLLELLHAERLIEAGSLSARHRAAETGPASEEVESLEIDSFDVIARFFRRPSVLLLLCLTILTLLASRGLMGSGRLMGGVLLPSYEGASDLWGSYLAAWHAVGLGSEAHAPPDLAIVAVVATLLLGKASLAVDVLLLGSVPLAGITAYAAARRIVESRILRFWAAVTYAVLPATTGAVASGRLGTAMGVALLPLLGLGAARVIGTAERPGTARSAWAVGLLLGIATAFVPLAWVLALIMTVVGFRVVARRGAAARVVIVLVTPVLVLLPWSVDVALHPALLLLEPGTDSPWLSDPGLGGLQLLLLHPGGPGMYPLWVSAGLLVAALLAVARKARRRVMLAGWTVALVGFGTALVLSRVQVQGPMHGTPTAPWTGLALTLMGAGLILAALIGGEGALEWIAARRRGLPRQIVASFTALAALTPAVAAGWWVVQGAGDPLDRRDPVLLPAYVAAEGQSAQHPRTLVLRSSGRGEVSYALFRSAGPRLGDADMLPDQAAYGGLDRVVATIVSGKGGAEANVFADYAIRYVLIQRPVDPELARALDAVAGLTRVSSPDGSGLWRLDQPSARLRLVSPDGATVKPLPSADTGAAATIPQGESGRRLVLAESADSSWQATIDGEPLSGQPSGGWAQSFEVPASGGGLTLSHDDTARTLWIIGQCFAVLVVIVLALPGGRRQDDDDESELPEPAVPRARRARTAAPVTAPVEATTPVGVGAGPGGVAAASQAPYEVDEPLGYLPAYPPPPEFPLEPQHHEPQQEYSPELLPEPPGPDFVPPYVPEQHEHVPAEYPQESYPPEGYPPAGYPGPPEGYPPQPEYPTESYPAQGYQLEGYPPQPEYPTESYPAQGYQPEGYPPQPEYESYPAQGYQPQPEYPPEYPPSYPEGYPSDGYPAEQYPPGYHPERTPGYPEYTGEYPPEYTGEYPPGYGPEVYPEAYPGGPAGYPPPPAEHPYEYGDPDQADHDDSEETGVWRQS
ncbi:MAG: glycosyltransferase [Streptomycetales bacterium]